MSDYNRFELPEPFFEPERPTPGVGRVGAPYEADPEQHFRGFSLAVQRALDNIHRAEGYYRLELTLSATVEVRNPGGVIEYIATFT